MELHKHIKVYLWQKSIPCLKKYKQVAASYNILKYIYFYIVVASSNPIKWGRPLAVKRKNNTLIFRVELHYTILGKNERSLNFEMKQIKKLCNTINLTWKMAVMLTIFIVSIITVHYKTSETFSWSDYECNIATELFGILITIIFVDNLFNRHNKNKAKQDEKSKIIRNHKIICIYITFYARQLHCITTAMEKRFKSNVQLEKEFSLQDLQYLYAPTLLLTESIQQSSIECFFKYEQELKNAFINTLNTIDFEFYPHVSKIIENFIEISTAFDVRAVILDNKKNNTLLDLFISMLKSDEIYERYEEYKNNRLRSNGILPYLMLYDMLKEEQKILLSYLSEIRNLS